MDFPSSGKITSCNLRFDEVVVLCSKTQKKKQSALIPKKSTTPSYIQK